MIGVRGRKVLVAGGGNFLGDLVALRLSECGADVCLAKNEKKGWMPKIISLPDHSEIKTSQLDKTGKLDFVLFLEHPVIIPNKLVNKTFINIEMSGLVKLLYMAGRHSANFIYASSASVYGRQKYLPIDEDHPLEPFSLYGAMKLAGEHFCRAMAMEQGFFYTILRFGEIYGPGNKDLGVPANLLKNAINNEVLSIKGQGGQVQSYVYIDDAVEAILKIVECGGKPPNQTVNIGGNEFISIWHLSNYIRNIFSLSSGIKTSPDVLTDDVECCIDTKKAESLYKFHPKTDLRSGLLKTYRWLAGKSAYEQPLPIP